MCVPGMEFELGVVSFVEEELAVGDDAMGTRLEIEKERERVRG